MPAQSAEWVSDRAGFLALAPEWDRLAAVQRVPFLLSAWLLPWWDAFGARRRLQIAVVRRNGEIVGGLPLTGVLGRWETPVNDHTPAFGMLSADDDARRSLVEELLERRAALVVAGLPEEEPSFATLLDAARRAGRWTLVEAMNTSLVTETSSSFEEFRAGLSSKVRSEVGRLRRKAEREHELEIKALAVPGDLDGQLDRAFALEASGWKGRAGTAIACSPQTERFYRQVAHNFHAAGNLRLSEMSLDGELVATAYTLVHQRRAFTLKVAYDERHRRLGPGFVLLLEMIEQCFEQGLDAYEFSGREEEYERRFATGERGHRRLRVYRPGAANAARVAYHRRLRPVLRAAYHEANRKGGPLGAPARLLRRPPARIARQN